MLTLIAIFAAFGVSVYIRLCNLNITIAILVPALLVPGAVTFEAFIYPADPEVAMWWSIAVVTTSLIGLLAAGAGYALAAFVLRRKNA